MHTHILEEKKKQGMKKSPAMMHCRGEVFIPTLTRPAKKGRNYRFQEVIQNNQDIRRRNESINQSINQSSRVEYDLMRC